MIVRKYQKEDFCQISEWLINRNSLVFHPNILPENGFIVDQVAAVFLYSTDSDFCYLENLVSNPDVDSKIRNEAISKMIEHAFAAASDLNFKFVLAVTDVPAVVARAVTLGAKTETNKTLLTKQLK